MSVAIDTDETAREKTEFDAEFNTTDEEQTANDEPICDLSCGSFFTV